MSFKYYVIFWGGEGGVIKRSFCITRGGGGVQDRSKKDHIIVERSLTIIHKPTLVIIRSHTCLLVDQVKPKGKVLSKEVLQVLKKSIFSSSSKLLDLQLVKIKILGPNRQ